MLIELEQRRVVLAGNPRVSPLGDGFEVTGLDESTRDALARALDLERQGIQTRVLMILDHPPMLKPSQLLRPERPQSLDSPHCNDLHTDIRGPIRRVLQKAKFSPNRLGILLEATIFNVRKKMFPKHKNCEAAAATAFCLASEYSFDPQRRQMSHTYMHSPVEVFLSPEAGMDKGHLLMAREYFKAMHLDPNLIIMTNNVPHENLQRVCALG